MLFWRCLPPAFVSARFTANSIRAVVFVSPDLRRILLTHSPWQSRASPMIDKLFSVSGSH